MTSTEAVGILLNDKEIYSPKKDEVTRFKTKDEIKKLNKATLHTLGTLSTPPPLLITITIHLDSKYLNERIARYVISVGVNPKTNVGMGVPSAGTARWMASQSGDSGNKKRHT